MVQVVGKERKKPLTNHFISHSALQALKAQAWAWGIAGWYGRVAKKEALLVGLVRGWGAEMSRPTKLFFMAKKV